MIKCNAILLVSFFLCFGQTVFAQTASDLDRVSSGAVVTCADAAYFVLQASGTHTYQGTTTTDTAMAAFEEASGGGYYSARVQGSSPVTYGELSLLCMKAFSLPGGIFYTLFPGPRYAYREMVYRQFIRGRSDPNMTVSGNDFLQILSRLLTEQEGSE